MCRCCEWPPPPTHLSLFLFLRPSETATDGNPSYRVEEEVTGWRAEVHPLVDVDLIQILFRLIHSLLCYSNPSYCPLFPWVHLHKTFRTHSFTCIHALVQHCRVHNAAGNWSCEKGQDWARPTTKHIYFGLQLSNCTLVLWWICVIGGCCANL